MDPEFRCAGPRTGGSELFSVAHFRHDGAITPKDDLKIHRHLAGRPNFKAPSFLVASSVERVSGWHRLDAISTNWRMLEDGRRACRHSISVSACNEVVNGGWSIHWLKPTAHPFFDTKAANQRSWQWSAVSALWRYAGIEILLDLASRHPGTGGARAWFGYCNLATGRGMNREGPDGAAPTGCQADRLLFWNYSPQELPGWSRAPGKRGIVSPLLSTC